jgi:hypothetical protein
MHWANIATARGLKDVKVDMSGILLFIRIVFTLRLVESCPLLVSDELEDTIHNIW